MTDVFCVPPSPHVTPELKDAEIASLEVSLEKHRITQAEFDEDKAAILAAP